MEEIRISTINECIQQTTNMIEASEKKQNEQMNKIEQTLETHKSEYTTSTAQIIEMLSMMRNEQHENHISHLNATQSLRNSPNEISQNSQLQIRSPFPLNTSSPDIHDPSTQNEKRGISIHQTMLYLNHQKK